MHVESGVGKNSGSKALSVLKKLLDYKRMFCWMFIETGSQLDHRPRPIGG